MSGIIKYWIPRNRYYELKYFCLQYPHFKELIARKDITSDIREGCMKAIYIIESSVCDVNCNFPDILLKSVTEGTTYKKLKCNVPTEEEFFDAYRKFFYFLSKKKGV